ncbi:MAG: archease [Proteobacteria bacterium]|nr:archease [Pseudomonadota bacterium]
MYQIIDHTADVGMRVEAGSLPELFTEAAQAMFDLMIEHKRSLIPSIEVPISVEAPSLDQLLVRWLSELLFVFESRRLVLMNFWIDELARGRLFGAAKGLKFDSARHAQKMEIKAVTYHRIKVEELSDGRWVAEVIFDI